LASQEIREKFRQFGQVFGQEAVVERGLRADEMVLHPTKKKKRKEKRK
jgi:hypothetical protein